MIVDMNRHETPLFSFICPCAWTIDCRVYACQDKGKYEPQRHKAQKEKQEIRLIFAVLKRKFSLTFYANSSKLLANFCG